MNYILLLAALTPVVLASDNLLTGEDLLNDIVESNELETDLGDGQGTATGKPSPNRSLWPTSLDTLTISFVDGTARAHTYVHPIGANPRTALVSGTCGSTLPGYEEVGWGNDRRCREASPYFIRQAGGCTSNAIGKSRCDADSRCTAFEWDRSWNGCSLFTSCEPYSYNSPAGRWGGRFQKCPRPTATPTRPPTATPTRPPTATPTRPPTAVSTPSSPTRTHVLPGWCREWRHTNTRVSQRVHGERTYFSGRSVTQAMCIARCNASSRCHQAVFEAAGPWGPQCWLGNHHSSARPTASRPCRAPAGRPQVAYEDFCFNKEGWESAQPTAARARYFLGRTTQTHPRSARVNTCQGHSDITQAQCLRAVRQAGRQAGALYVGRYTFMAPGCNYHPRGVVWNTYNGAHGFGNHAAYRPVCYGPNE